MTPTRARSKHMIQFFNHLIDTKSPAPATLTGYVSAIASVFALCDRAYTLATKEVKDLIKYQKKRRPLEQLTPPKWNLSFVLHKLSLPPFEPLETATSKFLTWKTCFLLLWATGCRRSELHALDLQSMKTSKGSVWKFVEFEPIPGFRAKNQYLDDLSLPRTYLVKALQGSSDEDLLSCPVRALQIYLDRTKSVRGKRRRLLLPIDPTSTKVKDITANTVSSWVKKTIVQAYSRSGSFTEDEYVRNLYGVDSQESANFHRAAHEVRAQSASYRFDSTHHSLEAIMRACYWRSSSVFTNFYLRDITLEDREHLLRLSTCAAPGRPDTRRPKPSA